MSKTWNGLSLYYSRVQITPNLLLIFSAKHRSYHARTAQETMTNLVFCQGWPVDPWMASGGNTWERWLAFQFPSGIGGGHRENTHTKKYTKLERTIKEAGRIWHWPDGCLRLPEHPYWAGSANGRGTRCCTSSSSVSSARDAPTVLSAAAAAAFPRRTNAQRGST